MFASKVTALHPTHPRRFLVVEDETDLGNLIKLYLQDFHAEIVVVERGDLGLHKALTEHWDLMILDLRLPGMDGLEVCREMRSKGVELPLIMLTARSTELDRVLGLELGADDYLTKPFSSLELAARVRALLRRSSRAQQPDTQEPNSLQINQLLLDKLQRRVLLSEVDIELTAREFDLLWFFASHPGRVFNRSELLDKVWGYGHEGYEHTVNSHINRLRAKIERNPSAPEYLLTVWGVGYKFCEHSSL
ncbi:response regulator transcription factor [Cellvibrio sp. OA-2007]|uniref:response regulator transcription factor n=1 Tax=Cellvibrio sp. OA-2007 TaxID=529823 RepID=UPI0007805BA3|nr:response regulator transcription factor [Cellvibrio sp. OA-2007]